MFNFTRRMGKSYQEPAGMATCWCYWKELRVWKLCITMHYGYVSSYLSWWAPITTTPSSCLDDPWIRTICQGISVVKRYQDCSYNWILTPRMRELFCSNLLPKGLWRILRSNLRWVNQWFFEGMGFCGKPCWSVKIAIVDFVSQSNALISRYLVDNHVLLHLAAIDWCSIYETVRLK